MVGGNWPGSHFCMLMDQDGVEVHKHTKRKQGLVKKRFQSYIFA